VSDFSKQEAIFDFNKARKKEIVTRLLGFLMRQKQELLSFEDVKSMLRPKAQAYRGLQVIPIELIVGSEGRYQDFSNQFLPRREHLRNRWLRVDEARIKDVILPPISLYELGGAYFVRDGNHRVSVARSQGVHAIDAEVIALNSEIQITPGISHEELRRKVIDYEYHQFLLKTSILELFPEADLRLSTTGQYDEMMYHIMGHKYFINQGSKEEIPLDKAIRSWYETVFLPIIEIVRDEALLDRFPGRTEADLYVWIIKHWHYLKEKYGNEVTVRDAADSYTALYGTTPVRRFRSFMDRVRAWFGGFRQKDQDGG
jgi:hypothetical protein